MASIILLIVLGVVYIISIKLLWLSYTSIHWPSSEGTIIDSHVVKVDWGEDPHFKPVVRYRFKVKSSVFESDNVKYQSFNPVLTENQASEKIRSFNVGDKVVVYYHPAQPSESVLLPGLTVHQRALVIAIVVMTVVLTMVVAHAT